MGSATMSLNSSVRHSSTVRVSPISYRLLTNYSQVFWRESRTTKKRKPAHSAGSSSLSKISHAPSASESRTMSRGRLVRATKQSALSKLQSPLIPSLSSVILPIRISSSSPSNGHSKHSILPTRVRSSSRQPRRGKVARVRVGRH